jgi:hypothetical protein
MLYDGRNQLGRLGGSKQNNFAEQYKPNVTTQTNCHAYSIAYIK